MRSRVRHELKTWPEYFAATRHGYKKFELRRDDRPEGFQVGDELLLKEWFPNRSPAYTGRELLVRVEYILRADDLKGILNRPYFVDSGAANGKDFVIMSVSLVN